jgi:hypothetical protein
MRHSIVFLLVLMAPLATMAQIDPDPDGVGFYADEGATINHLDVLPGVQVDVYLVLTRPSTPMHYVCGWSCRVGKSSNVNVISSLIRWGGTNFSSWPDFDVGIYDCVYSGASHVVLLSLHVSLTDDQPGYLYVGETPLDPLRDGLPCYADPYWPPLYALYPSSGSVDAPVFTFNGSGPVPDAGRTWGALKALFTR